MRSKKIAILGMFAAIAIVLSIVENTAMNMFNLAIPGAKPGFANIAVVLALYYLGGMEAGIVAAVKCTAVFLATGAATTLLFSIGGTALAMAGMIAAKQCRMFSAAGVSALGGFLNNLGQLAVMALLGGSAGFFYYLPVLSVLGVSFGLLMGVLAEAVLRRKLCPIQK